MGLPLNHKQTPNNLIVVRDNPRILDD